MLFAKNLTKSAAINWNNNDTKINIIRYIQIR